MIKEYKDSRAQGIIHYSLQFCHTYNIEAIRIKDACEKNSIPFLAVESDYSPEDVGQIQTRVEAFLEGANGMDFSEALYDEVAYLYRDPQFDRGLETLRRKGGYAAVAAAKADEFISLVMKGREAEGRNTFRLTRRGEARIRNCRKVDLGCGYRLVCIKKDRELALLYVGTHDECLRWIHHRRGLAYESEGPVNAVRRIDRKGGGREAEQLPPDVQEERRMLEAYEAALMNRIDDAALRKVFPGLCGSEEANAVPQSDNEQS